MISPREPTNNPAGFCRNPYLFRTFPGLKERLDQLAGTMSSGEQAMLFEQARLHGRAQANWSPRAMPQSLRENAEVRAAYFGKN